MGCASSVLFGGLGRRHSRIKPEATLIVVEAKSEQRLDPLPVPDVTPFDPPGLLTADLVSPSPEISDFLGITESADVTPSPRSSPHGGQNARNRRPSRRRVSRIPSGFGDLEIEVETQLEDRLVADYRQSKPQAEFSLDGAFRFPACSPPKKEVAQQAILQYRVSTLLGHPTRVKFITLSPSERQFVSCAYEDTTLSMYDIVTGQQIVTYSGHDDAVLGASFSPDGRLLATCSRDCSVLLWDAVTGKRLYAFDHDRVAICCAFSPDGFFLVSGSQDHVCRVWDIKRRREASAFRGHSGVIVSAAWAPEELTIASASADKSVRLWDARSGCQIQALKGHAGVALACAWHPEGRLVVSLEEAAVRVWEAHSGRCLRSLSVADVVRTSHPLSGRPIAWTALCFAPDRFGGHIVAAASDRSIHVLDATTGDNALTLFTRAPVYCLSSGSDHTLAFGDTYGNLSVVELD